jgi:hypothetical protein
MPFTNPHPLYSVWRGIISRCTNPRYRQWDDYGGRGIRVCDRWRHDFRAFVADMGPRPAGAFIDRTDNDGNYEPTNCAWVTRRQSQRNQRVTRWVEIEGTRYRAVDLSDISGLKTDTIVERAKLGLTYAEVISPLKRYNLTGFALGVPARRAKRAARLAAAR